VRGQALLIALVATVLSASFWLIGLPYWLLVGVFAGVIEIVPVIGSLAAGALAVGVGLILLAVPLAAVIGTLVEVVVLEKNPEEEEVPTVLFPAPEAETTSV
jgi:predicted PurR-regulated permease PerM